MSVEGLGLELRLTVATSGRDDDELAAAWARAWRNSVLAWLEPDDCAPALAGEVGRGPGSSPAGAALDSSPALGRGGFGAGNQAETDPRLP